MTRDDLKARLAAKFPKIETAAVEVKGYLTLRLAAPQDLIGVASWLKDGGFDYLDIVTAVDFKGPVDAKGYVTDPNPNVFRALPAGATPQVETPTATPGFPYRDRIEVVYCLSSLKERLKVFLKLEVPRDGARVPSLTPLFKAADWQEREAFDLFGVVFEGHPNMTKILTPDFIQGHPGRKDYVHAPDKYD